MNPTELRVFRAKHDLTQAKLAEKLGLSAATISAYEATGNIPVTVDLALKQIELMLGEKLEHSNTSAPSDGFPN